jgi:hypothetical protein
MEGIDGCDMLLVAIFRGVRRARKVGVLCATALAMPVVARAVVLRGLPFSGRATRESR